MIRLTRLNHIPMVLNSDLIEHIEMTPDTVITLTSGQKLIVLESADDVVREIVQYRRLINQCPLQSRLDAESADPALRERKNGL
jgi:flagellar protein FlbD